MGITIAEILLILLRILFYILIIAGWFLVFYLFFNAYKKRRKRLWIVAQEYTTLLVLVPRNNEKGPLSAQLMFASLHGIYKSARERLEEGSFQEHISFEIVSMSKYIKFYIYTPKHLRDFVEGQVYSQYPTVEISEVEDYTLAKRPDGLHFVGTELALTREDFYPIKTFVNFEVDPLAGITGVLSQVEDDEQIWTQILARPVDDAWQKKAIDYINAIRSGKLGGGGLFGKIFSPLGFLIKIIRVLSGPSESAAKLKEVKLSGPAEQAIKAIEDKSTKLGYEVKIRVVFLSKKPSEQMKIKLQSIVGAFKQFNASNLNSFISRGVYLDDPAFLNDVQVRNFINPGFILNIEELASLYHLPNITVETPSIVWAGSKKGEPPATLPIEEIVDSQDLTVFAKTNFRNKVAKFGIKMNDRRRHMYIIGQTGTGKSTLMKQMVADDIREGRGLAVIDPHGEFIDSALEYIPEHRINDVVIMNPGDKEYSVGFNPLENIDPTKREILASGMMSIFMKIWEGVWSARMEHIMRNCILALLEIPGSTMLGITKMLVNKEYRKMIVDNVTDPVVKEYWTEEFENQLKTNPRFLTEAVAPIQNKIGAFLAAPSVRNIVGQSKSTIDFKDIMDNKKILLIKISKGEIGEDNMALLGAMIITKIQLTALERTGMREEEMNDFFLYVDEFQNFATTTFATILSEARKYKLSLIIAHQYISQMSEEVRAAVIGNAGTIVAFRVGPDDTAVLKRVFEPVFGENDLLNLDNFHIYIKLMIDNSVNPAFSAVTLPPLPLQEGEGNRKKVIELSREKYTIPREEVEKAIIRWSEETASLEQKERKKKEEAKEKIEKEIEKKGEGIREIRDKKGGIWYARKKSVGAESSDLADKHVLPLVQEKKEIIETSNEGTRGHKNIKDIKKEASLSDAQDKKTIYKDLEEESFHGSYTDLNKEARKEDEKNEKESTIKPGETIEL